MTDQQPLSFDVENAKTNLLGWLRGQSPKLPLFAILDAARDPRILELLKTSNLSYVSLFSGPSAEIMAEYAPYLVLLPKDTPFLETLVDQGWGQSWGVYLWCSSSLEQVRSHLRHFTIVNLPSGKSVYFRFYDPRVLRAYLPTCNREETLTFFGPIDSYLMESKNGDALIKAKNKAAGVDLDFISLVDNFTSLNHPKEVR